MKPMSELREMATEQLEKELAQLSEDLFHLRFQKATAQLRNTAKLGSTKRERARVLTVLAERKSGAETSGSDAEVAT